MNETAAHTLTLPWVENATSQFVNAGEMREAFSLAVTAGVNLIFSGPGGHGKSQFLEAAIGAIQDIEPYVKSFGQGTTPDELYGGLDLDALNRQGGAEKATIQYTPELSFLAYPIAVFEEVFDAPSRVLTSLKDTLTARELRNGHQRFPMVTKVIAGATNHSPQDIAEGGPEIAALVERFPVQLEVKWSNYSEKSFVDLFASVTSDAPEFEKVTWNDVAALQQRANEVKITSLIQRMLARIIVEMRGDGVVISPRTAVLAMQLARAAAAINGRDQVIAKDLSAIAYLPGAHPLIHRIADLIDECIRTMGDEEELDRLHRVLEDARGFTVTSERQCQDFIQLLNDIRAKASGLRLSTDQNVRRNDFLRETRSVLASAEDSLVGFQLVHKRDEHEAKLKSMAREIKQLSKDLRYAASEHKRDTARQALVHLDGYLATARLHPSLEDLRQDLRMKIKLTGALN